MESEFKSDRMNMADRIATEEQERFERLEEQINSCFGLFTALVEDVRALSPTDNNPAIVRSRVRAFFALVEGSLYAIRNLALSIGEVTRYGFGPGEREFLSEKRYKLSSSGDVKTVDRYLTLEESLKFSLRQAMKVLGKSYSVDTGSSGWNSFVKAKKIRNKLTHPKSPVDIEIDKDVMDTIDKALTWFVGLIEDYLPKFTQAFGELREDDDVKRRMFDPYLLEEVWKIIQPR